MTKTFKRYKLVRELQVLADQMSVAMVLAETTHISKGFLTPRMLDILARYRAWAVDASKVGL